MGVSVTTWNCLKSVSSFTMCLFFCNFTSGRKYYEQICENCLMCFEDIN